MPRGTVLISLFVYFLLAGNILAYCSQEGMKKFSNRLEGVTSELHGDQDMILVGLHRNFDSFSKNDSLMVQFFLPNTASLSLNTVFVEAREIVDTTHYFMQSTKAIWQKGIWNTFSPWPTRDVIDPLGLNPDNIGVIAGYRDETGQPVYIPVDVSLRPAQPTESRYSLYFETSHDLKSLDESIEDSSGQKIFKKNQKCTISPNCVLFPAASSHAITIDMTDQKEGVYSISLEGYEPRSTHSISLEVRIYHRGK